MTATRDPLSKPRDWLDRLATALALAGGLLLLALVALETVSVLGRSLPELLAWTGLPVVPRSVPGDSEIAQALTAVALFSFLPYCQMRGGHIRIEVFSARLPARLRSGLDVVWSAVFAALSAILAWRLTLGCLAKASNGDSTMVLRIPEAVPFAAAVGCTVILVASVVRTLPIHGPGKP